MELFTKEESIVVNFIKWMAGYSEGFCLVNNGNNLLDPCNRFYDIINTIEAYNKIAYPLLLHKTVIGVNKHSETWSITLYPFIVVVTDNDYIKVKFGDGDIGQSQEKNIEKALEYIYEQEKKSEN